MKIEADMILKKIEKLIAEGEKIMVYTKFDIATRSMVRWFKVDEIEVHLDYCNVRGLFKSEFLGRVYIYYKDELISIDKNIWEFLNERTIENTIGDFGLEWQKRIEFKQDELKRYFEEV